MTHRYRAGQLVEVVYTHEEYRLLRGERFILRNIARLSPVPAWETPFAYFGFPLYAGESCLRPIDDDGRQKKDWTDVDCVWSPYTPQVIRRRRAKVPA
jgi:hypothetical protein